MALPLSEDAQTYARSQSLYDCDLRRLVALNNFLCTEICSSAAASLVIHLHLKIHFGVVKLGSLETNSEKASVHMHTEMAFAPLPAGVTQATVLLL